MLVMFGSRHGQLRGMTHEPWRHVRLGSSLGFLAFGPLSAQIASAGCRQPQPGTVTAS